MVQQYYDSEVNNAYVIRGNSAILKCSIPSFVADFVAVVSWNDDAGNVYQQLDNRTVQSAELEVGSCLSLRAFLAGQFRPKFPSSLVKAFPVSFLCWLFLILRLF